MTSPVTTVPIPDMKLSQRQREAKLDSLIFGHPITWLTPDDPRRPDGSPVPAYEDSDADAVALAVGFAREKGVALTMTVHPDGEVIAMVLWTLNAQPLGGCFNVPTVPKAVCYAILSYADNLDAGRLQSVMDAVKEQRPRAND